MSSSKANITSKTLRRKPQPVNGTVIFHWP